MADKKGVMKLQIPAVYEMECDCDPFAGGFPGTGCECDPSKLDEVLEKLEGLEFKIIDLEQRVEDCQCCDCPKPDVTISLSETSVELTVGDTIQLIATVGPADLADKSVTWSSSDPSVATVDQDGLVTAVANGNVIIIATTNVGGKIATCDITVTVHTVEIPDSLLGCEYVLPFGVSATQNFGTAGSSAISAINPLAELSFNADKGATFPKKTGANTYVSIRCPNAKEWTIGCWVNLNEPKIPTDMQMPFMWGSTVAVSAMLFAWTSNALKSTYFYSYRGSPSLTYSGIKTNEWHHYAITSQGTCYVDGVAVGNGSVGTKTASSATELRIGGAGSYYTGRDLYGGNVSNFFLKQNVVFTAAQIKQIYDLGYRPYS